MSRIGKRPILIPSGVTVQLERQRVRVRGPKGELTVPIHAHATVEQADGALRVRVEDPMEKDDRAIWGLTARLLSGAIAGVIGGYSEQLEIQGVGFRVAAKGSKALEFHIGYSHPVAVELPEGISASIEKNVVTVSGIDKQLVGEIAARLRTLRPPDAYHGKGIRYVGEEIKLKPGKAVKSAGAA